MPNFEGSHTMSVTQVIKHIYNHGSDEVVRRGKRIFLTKGVTLLKKDELSGQIHFRVRNDQYYNQYNVTITKYKEPEHLNARCSCPYNMGVLCRHEVAALFFLNDLILNNQLNSEGAKFDQTLTTIRMNGIDLKSLRLYTSSYLFDLAEKLITTHKPQISYAQNEVVKAEIIESEETNTLTIKRNDDKSFDTSCTCNESKYALCHHKVALFLQLVNSYGSHYFDSIRDWDSQKNKLLGIYGYSIQDDLKNKFEFYYRDSKPFLKVLDTSIKKIAPGHTKQTEFNENEVNSLHSNQNKQKQSGIGIVLNLSHEVFPFFRLDVICGEYDTEEKSLIGKVQKIEIAKLTDSALHNDFDKELINLVKKLQTSESNKYVSKNSSLGDLWEYVKVDDNEWNIENKTILYQYLHPKLLKLLNKLSDTSLLYILPKGKAFKTDNIQKVKYKHHNIYPSVTLRKHKNNYKVDVDMCYDDYKVNMAQNLYSGALFFMTEHEVYLTHKPIDACNIDLLLEYAEISPEKWGITLQNVLIPMSKLYEFDIQEGLLQKNAIKQPGKAVILREQGPYFIIQPAFDYDGHLLEWSDELLYSTLINNQLMIIERDKQDEQFFVNWIKDLHPQLTKPEYEFHYSLHARHALSSNWFFTFYEQLDEFGVKLYGYETLKSFKVHKARPTTKVYVSSGQDWFDTSIEIDFDGQKINPTDIRKAILKKQNYVPLADGSMGMLPEEWIQKFSLLFKMADYDGNTLKVSKYNFTIIDELYDLIDDEDILEELDYKRKKMLAQETDEFDQIEIPSQIRATLRPYQEAGFRWMVYLDSVGWGGLLADDMGLGKTLQTLTFLQYYFQQHQQLKVLVVCPTSLVYNWENEIKKFTTGLNYTIHHGLQRSANAKKLQEHHIIITTYGTLRSDVDVFRKIDLDYVVLDESQSIKNPISKTAKATQLLIAKNRLALSGTPMQNNTFDLFSQMQFLNPGMLGSKDFFKEQFAKPIDKFQEDETKKQLKKLVYPFLLRRTKEQVAKDLPEKTEITLYCEMGKEQRQIYELYREKYRSFVLDNIDNKGIHKSQFAILQGLMKLRQICDSPAILNDPISYENHSAKLDELTREIADNIGEHKVLIFSQFLGMLALIKQRLTELNVTYQYFDGSYTATQREHAVRDFQENTKCSVFLISLKAGGMGLNLTAADYVYIVDPWWNPAVEQQAIDRTHRIGQTKSIFAYRMICKDTVEDKIMNLKEKKNSLVKDIISDDDAMVKKLTREDIEYLFS